MTHKLPTLPYSFDALEPHIDAQTVELHYTKHHQAYVDGLNKALEALAKARENSDYSSVKHLKRELAFHGGGHVLHTLYWGNLCPTSQAKGKASGELLAQIEKTWGSFENFEKEFKTCSAVVEGSGWGVLVSFKGNLEILTVEKHQDVYLIDAVPILVCDVWEHAYYLKYQNKRPAYIDGFWSLVNWEEVEKRYEQSLK